jgi:hypothetical protein
MPWHGFCKAGSNQCCIFHNALAQFLQDRFWSVIWPSLDTCIYTFEKEFSTSILHMRPIGFKSSAYYTQKWNKTWSPDLSLFPCTIYFMVENNLYLNVGHW